MRRLFLALFIGAIPGALWLPLGFVVFTVAYVVLLLTTTPTCPHCHRLKPLGAPVCHRCGRTVRA
ncbi:MAG: hypothetical protein ACRDMH_05200 [Solirubrobacterales bacterium]